MRITLQDVLAYAADRANLEPVEVYGIPDGFAYKYADVEIAGIKHTGELLAFIPLSDWKMVTADTYPKLVELYNKENIYGEGNKTGKRSTTKNSGWDG